MFYMNVFLNLQGVFGLFTSRLSPSISFNGLEKKFIYPTWVKENCKNFSDKNTACNMAKIQFEKYEKVEKIQNFEISIAKQMQMLWIKNH